MLGDCLTGDRRIRRQLRNGEGTPCAEDGHQPQACWVAKCREDTREGFVCLKGGGEAGGRPPGGRGLTRRHGGRCSPSERSSHCCSCETHGGGGWAALCRTRIRPRSTSSRVQARPSA